MELSNRSMNWVSSKTMSFSVRFAKMNFRYFEYFVLNWCKNFDFKKFFSLISLSIDKIFESSDCLRLCPMTPFGLLASTTIVAMQPAFEAIFKRGGSVARIKDSSERATKIKQDILIKGFSKCDQQILRKSDILLHYLSPLYSVVIR